MPYRVYKYAGKWHFKDSLGITYTYDTERGAKRMATIRKKAIKEYIDRYEIRSLHYDSPDNFGRTVYEEMYQGAGNEEAYNANNGSGEGQSVLAWMMHHYSTNEFIPKDDIPSLGGDTSTENNPKGLTVNQKFKDGYTVRGVLRKMGFTLVHFSDEGWRLFKNADARYENILRRIFGVNA